MFYQRSHIFSFKVYIFKHCDWISYSQLQLIIKWSLSPSFRNEICQGFMGSKVDRKPLASEDVLFWVVYWKLKLLRGHFKTDNLDIFHIRIADNVVCMSTEVYMIIEILSDRWWKQKLGTEYSIWWFHFTYNYNHNIVMAAMPLSDC